MMAIEHRRTNHGYSLAESASTASAYASQLPEWMNVEKFEPIHVMKHFSPQAS